MTVAERFQELKDKYYYDKKDADSKVAFIEKYCQHTKGAKAGTPLLLDEFQKEEIIKPIFGLKESKGGFRLINTVYIEVPRKNGKTTLCAPIELILLFNDGEPGAEIYNCAGDDEQANQLFSITKTMVLKDHNLSSRAQTWKSTITYKDSFIKKITSKSDTKHGFNSHGVIYDELHVATNDELYNVLYSSMGARRNPLMVVITTAGTNKNSICYDLHDLTSKILQGILTDDTHWGVIYSADFEDDINDIETLRKANPLYDSSEELRRYLDRALKRLKNEPSFESSFRRLHLNQWVGTAETWILDEYWMANKGEPILEGECYGGLDLATVQDIAAFNLIFPGEKVSSVWWFFVPEEVVEYRSRKEGIKYDLWVNENHIIATPGNVIDYDYIVNVVLECKEKYNIKAIGFDRWGTKEFFNSLNAYMSDSEIDRLFYPVGQGFASQSNPTKELERIVIKNEMLHGGNPVIRWMMANVQIETDAAANIKVTKKKSREKVDGVVACVNSIFTWMELKNTGHSIYETRGILDINDDFESTLKTDSDGTIL